MAPDAEDSRDHGRVTELLRAVRSGQREHEAELFSLIYQQMRRMAQKHMHGERAGHTLQATALVHEVYLRIFGRENVDWRSRSHFLSIASREFRRALVEHARAVKANKRGGDSPKVSIESLNQDQPGVAPVDVDVIHLHDLLEELQKMDPEAGRVVELRFFSGLTDQEIADETGFSFAKVRRDWTFARSWLAARLETGAV